MFIHLEMIGSLNRETLTLVAVVIALASVFYLYKELKKTNTDVMNCKTFSQALAQQITQPPVRETKPKQKKRVTIKEEPSEVEGEEDEEEDAE
jgi:hypothetical protein